MSKQPWRIIIVAALALAFVAARVPADEAAAAAPAGEAAAPAADAPPAEAPTDATAEAPEKVVSVDEALAKGVEFLIKNQNEDGSWGTGRVTRGFEVYHSVPGSHDAFRVATTALCVMALREAAAAGIHPEAGAAHQKGLEYLVTKPDAKRDDGRLIYNVWAHTYGLQALSIEMRQSANPDPRIKAAAEKCLEHLVRYETWMGGWNYYDFDAQTKTPSMAPTSFGTAAGLVALWEAKQSGLDVPQKLIDRATRRLEEMRVPGGSYLYSHDHKYYPRGAPNRPRGSVGRTQSCNFALWLWESEKVDRDVAVEGMEMFFKEHRFIDMGRKRQWPHEAWYATAPYYYYFGHYYAGLLVEKLGDQGLDDYGPKLAATIVPHQDPDGSWWDYAMWDYHKPYGTAYAVMTLLRCEKAKKD